MEYVYAALLLHKLKQNITEDSVKSVVQAAGVTPDDVRVKALVAALSEVQIDEVLKAAPVAVAAAAAPAAAGAARLNCCSSSSGNRRSRWRRSLSQRGRKEGRRSPRRPLVAVWLGFHLRSSFSSIFFFLIQLECTALRWTWKMIII